MYVCNVCIYIYVCVNECMWSPVKLWRAIQLCPLWQATCPCKDWCNRVGRCRQTFLVLPKNTEVKVYTLLTNMYTWFIIILPNLYTSINETVQQWCCTVTLKSVSFCQPHNTSAAMLENGEEFKNDWRAIYNDWTGWHSISQMQQEWINWFWVAGATPGSLLYLQ